MAEYISKEALLKVLRGSAVGKYPASFYMGLFAAASEVEKISAADVAPVRHGRWISLTECANAGVYCSVCNKKVYKEDYAWSNKRIKMRSNYCPNCGARMDG